MAESPGLAVLQSDPRPAPRPQSLRVSWWWAGEVTSQGRVDQGTLPPSPGFSPSLRGAADGGTLTAGLTGGPGCASAGRWQQRAAGLSFQCWPCPRWLQGGLPARHLAACAEGPCRWGCGPGTAPRSPQSCYSRPEQRPGRDERPADSAPGYAASGPWQSRDAELAGPACLPFDSVTSPAPKSGPQHSEEPASRPSTGSLSPPRPLPASGSTARGRPPAKHRLRRGRALSQSPHCALVPRKCLPST